MTTTVANTPTSEATQQLRQIAPKPRDPRGNGASFDRVLLDRLAPPRDTADEVVRPEQTDPTHDKAEETVGAEEPDAEGDGSPDQDPTIEQSGGSDGSDDSGVRPESTDPSAASSTAPGRAEPTARPGESSQQPSTSDDPEPDRDGTNVPIPVDGSHGAPSVPVRAERTQRDRVRLELKQAARVDLAELAAGELTLPTGPAATDDVRGPRDGPIDRKPSLDHERPHHRAGGSPETPESPIRPAPERSPELGVRRRSQPVPAPAPEAHTPGKQPTEPASAITATQGASTDRDADRPAADAAIGRSVLLDQLASSSDARRGAVSAPDRVISVDTLRARPGERTLGLEKPEPAARRPLSDAVLQPVQKGLAKMLAQGGGRMTVLLKPESLGEVRLRMQAREGAVRLRIEAATETARSTLESGLDGLRASLEAKGVRVEHIEVAHTHHAAPGGDPTSDPGTAGTGHDEHARDHGGGSGSPDRHPHEDPQDEGPILAGATSARWTELGIDTIA